MPMHLFVETRKCFFQSLCNLSAYFDVTTSAFCPQIWEVGVFNRLDILQSSSPISISHQKKIGSALNFAPTQLLRELVYPSQTLPSCCLSILDPQLGKLCHPICQWLQQGREKAILDLQRSMLIPCPRSFLILGSEYLYSSYSNNPHCESANSLIRHYWYTLYQIT